MKRQYFLLLSLGWVLAAQPENTRRRIETALFVPDPAPMLAPVSYGSFEPTPGVVAERISYGTEFGMRIPAVLYRPARPAAQKAPAIVVVNGHRSFRADLALTAPTVQHPGPESMDVQRRPAMPRIILRQLIRFQDRRVLFDGRA